MALLPFPRVLVLILVSFAPPLLPSSPRLSVLPLLLKQRPREGQRHTRVSIPGQAQAALGDGCPIDRAGTPSRRGEPPEEDTCYNTAPNSSVTLSTYLSSPRRAEQETEAVSGRPLCCCTHNGAQPPATSGRRGEQQAPDSGAPSQLSSDHQS